MFASTLLNKGYEVHVIYKSNNKSNSHTNLPNSIKYVPWDKIRGNKIKCRFCIDFFIELMGDNFAEKDEKENKQ